MRIVNDTPGPPSSQMSAKVQISRELDKQAYPLSMDSHNIEYLRRRDGDLRFREMASQGKDLLGFKDFPHRDQGYSQAQAHVKSYEKAQPAPAIKENEKVYEVELSL